MAGPLPDDDAGRDEALVMAHHLARRPGDRRRHITAWLELWAPWMPPAEVAALITAVLARPIRWRADTLAQRLNLTDAERRRLRITTIGASDKTKAQRLAERKERKRAADRLRRQRNRQARGARPRPDYEATSLTRIKPWERLGMSRAGWYRHRKLAA